MDATKEIKIIPPEGYEVDKENSTLELIKFKPVKTQLPKTWEEFCAIHLLKKGEAYINSTSIINLLNIGHRNPTTDKNILPSLEYAKAMLALCQLIQLRDCYNDGWKPDWTNPSTVKHCVGIMQNRIVNQSLLMTNKMMAFKTKELRDEFIKNFKELIEVAKPLL